jgi:hypothetical protein
VQKDSIPNPDVDELIRRIRAWHAREERRKRTKRAATRYGVWVWLAVLAVGTLACPEVFTFLVAMTIIGGLIALIRILE